MILMSLMPAVVCAFVTLRTTTSEPLAASQPKTALTFASRLYQHGDSPVAVGSTLESEFQFRNDGTETITFGDIERSCSCMTPRLSKQSLEPGEVGSLIVPIQTLQQTPGPHEYNLFLNYSDPQPKRTALTIKAVFPEKMVVVHPKVLFISQRSSQPVDFDVSISDFRDRPLQVTDVQATAPFVAINASHNTVPKIQQASYSEETDSPSGVTNLKGKVAGDIPPGRHVVLLTATTDDSEFPVVTVPVMINGPAYPPGVSVKATPQQVQLVASDHPQAMRSAMVKVLMPSSWEVSHANAWPPELDVQFDEGKPKTDSLKEVTVNVQLTELPTDDLLDGVIQLVANNGKNLVTVRVVFHHP